MLKELFNVASSVAIKGLQVIDESVDSLASYSHNLNTSVINDSLKELKKHYTEIAKDEVLSKAYQTTRTDGFKKAADQMFNDIVKPTAGSKETKK